LLRPQTPLGELTALPQTSSWIKDGLLLRGGEGIWDGRGRGGKGEDREEEGKEGKGGDPNILLHPTVPIF